MNAVQALLASGLVDEIKTNAIPGESYFVGPSGIKSSDDAIPDELEKVAGKISSVTPEGARAIAWFCLGTDGSRLEGQIALDHNEGSPQVIWTLGRENPELDYGRRHVFSFSSASDQLVAMADPVEALRHVGTKHDESTICLLRALGYMPVLPQSPSLLMNIERLELVENDNG